MTIFFKNNLLRIQTFLKNFLPQPSAMNNPLLRVLYLAPVELDEEKVVIRKQRHDQNKLAKIRRCVTLFTYHLATLVGHLATLVDEQQIPTEWLATPVDQHTPRD